MDPYFKALLYFSAIFFPFLLMMLIRTLNHYVHDEKHILKLEDEYAGLVRAREDLLHHYYWKMDTKEFEGFSFLKTEIVKVTKTIMRLRKEFKMRYRKPVKAKTL